jgi:hypothetical protein
VSSSLQLSDQGGLVPAADDEFNLNHAAFRLLAIK